MEDVQGIDCKASGCGSENGFTLLELIIVMLIAAVVMSLSAAFFANSSPSSAFGATTREMAAAVRLGRSLAQIKGESQTLTIDLDNRSYGIEGRGEKSLPATVSVKVIDPVAGEITRGKYNFIFPAIGGAEGGTIVLWDKTHKAQISLDPVAGSVVTK